jgi:hypothetical protein
MEAQQLFTTPSMLLKDSKALSMDSRELSMDGKVLSGTHAK